jgi:hypothetical protein
MTATTDTRASGLTAGEEAAEEEGVQLDQPFEEKVTTEERERGLTRTTFSRMKLEWPEGDLEMRLEIQEEIDRIIADVFGDAHQLIFDAQDEVRIPKKLSPDGKTVLEWERTPSGRIREEWGRMSPGTRESYMLSLTTGLMLWEARAEDFRGDSMFAKAIWTEKFARHFDAADSRTIDGRNAIANMSAAERKYYALYLTQLSRRADVVIRNVALLAQRLKDTLAR